MDCDIEGDLQINMIHEANLEIDLEQTKDHKIESLITSEKNIVTLDLNLDEKVEKNVGSDGNVENQVKKKFNYFWL